MGTTELCKCILCYSRPLSMYRQSRDSSWLLVWPLRKPRKRKQYLAKNSQCVCVIATAVIRSDAFARVVWDEIVVITLAASFARSRVASKVIHQWFPTRTKAPWHAIVVFRTTWTFKVWKNAQICYQVASRSAQFRKWHNRQHYCVRRGV